MKTRKMITLMATTVMMTLSANCNVFASSLVYNAEEGIGIEVELPRARTTSTIEGDKVSVAGGKLWVTWKDGVKFRANYDHSSKTHRCSVTNDHQTRMRSEWTPKGITAVSPWLDQTLTNNRAYAATK